MARLIGSPLCCYLGEKTNGFIRAYFWGMSSSTSYEIPSSYPYYINYVDRDYCTWSSENLKFTIVTGGTYIIGYFAKGSYTSTGSSVRVDWRIMKTNSDGTTSTTLFSGTRTTATGTDQIRNVILEAGDVIYAEIKNYSTSAVGNNSFGFFLAMD